MGFYYEPVFLENRERCGNFKAIRAQFSVRLKVPEMFLTPFDTDCFSFRAVAGVPLTPQHGIQWVMGLAE